MDKQGSSNAQEAHYETIHDDYEAHYYDKTSMEYRHKFIYGPLFSGLQLDGASVADLACGSGHNSLALRDYFPGVTTTGYDISETACREYQRNCEQSAHQLDLTLPIDPQIVHDAALVIGGLHHCVADLPTTLQNTARMIRPGGLFLMMEPNDEFLLSSVRNLWYRKDRWFEADSEAALRHDELVKLAEPYFVSEKVRYVGGPAFYLILNSLILRVPLKLKPFLAKFLFPIERLYRRLPGRWPYAIFLAVWRRTDTPA